jgi:hypothetical protein
MDPVGQSMIIQEPSAGIAEIVTHSTAQVLHISYSTAEVTRSSLFCVLTVNGQPVFTSAINVTHVSLIMGRMLLISATYGLLADDDQRDTKRIPLQRYRVLY